MAQHAYSASTIPRHARVLPGGAPESLRRRGPAAPLAVAALCLIALAVTWAVSALVPSARAKDAIALHDFTLLSRPHVDDVAKALLHVLEPAPFTAIGVLLVGIALLRRRPAVACAVALAMSLAPLTSELLKPLLAHGHDQVAGTYIAAASWPSGHATAAAVLVLCAALISPARTRPIVALLGGLFAAAVGCSLLVLAWHMPSDVIGGYLVGALWVALAVAGLRLRSPGRRAPRGVPITARA